MEFFVSASTGLSFGGAGPVHTVGDFLLGDRRDFGSAVQEITVELLLEPPARGVADLVERHRAAREKAPTITFGRARRTVTVAVASNLAEQDIFPPPRRKAETDRDPVALYTRGVEEVLAALQLLTKRIKPADDFDLAGFLAHVAAARTRLPESAEDLAALTQRLQSEYRARYEAVPAWERLDVAWAGYHPRARSLLDDPFFWDGDDDLSPHGNDTGHDLLAEYRAAAPWTTGTGGLEFLEKVFRTWGYEGPAAVDPVVADQAVIATAFAELKLTGALAEPLRDAAVAAVARRRQRALGSEQHRDIQLAALDRIEAGLSGQAGAARAGRPH